GGYQLTKEGYITSDRVWNYGVPFSYTPLYARAEQLMSENPMLPKPGPRGEPLVFRDVNVKGSGGTHEEQFADLRNASQPNYFLPIEDQPRGFFDIGAGDGKFARGKALDILHHTERGRQMKLFPNREENHVIVAPVDPFENPRKIITRTLERANLP